MFNCIGKRRVKRHSTDKGELVACTNRSEVASNPARPEWGFLCPDCANAAPAGAPTIQEEFNAAAMQADPSEFRDQIASGFMTGMHDSDRIDGE